MPALSNGPHPRPLLFQQTFTEYVAPSGRIVSRDYWVLQALYTHLGNEVRLQMRISQLLEDKGHRVSWFVHTQGRTIRIVDDLSCMLADLLLPREQQRPHISHSDATLLLGRDAFDCVLALKSAWLSIYKICDLTGISKS